MPLTDRQVLAGQIFVLAADHVGLNAGAKAVVDGVEEGAGLNRGADGVFTATFAGRLVGTYQAGIRVYGSGSAFSEVLMALEVVAAPPSPPTNLRIVR